MLARYDLAGPPRPGLDPLYERIAHLEKQRPVVLLLSLVAVAVATTTVVAVLIAAMVIVQHKSPPFPQLRNAGSLLKTCISRSQFPTSSRSHKTRVSAWHQISSAQSQDHVGVSVVEGLQAGTPLLG